MKKTDRETVRRMRCGEYEPETLLEDGRLLRETEAAGLFADCTRHFRQQERRLRRMNFWLVCWLLLAAGGGAGRVAGTGDPESWSYLLGILVLALSTLGVTGWFFLFLVRIWRLMPRSGFRVTPSWRVLLGLLPFWAFYWSFRIFLPLAHFPEEQGESAATRKWTLKMLYYLACLPVIQLFGSASKEYGFTILLLLANGVVLGVFYWIFRRKARLRLQRLAAAYEAAAVSAPAATPEWRRTWRQVLHAPRRLALGIAAVLAGMWGCDLVVLQTELPGRNFESGVMADLEKGVSSDALQKEFQQLALRLAEIPYEDGEITAATHMAVEKNAAAAAAFGTFLDQHPDFRLAHDWEQGGRMNGRVIEALRRYGDHVYAAGVAALKKRDYAPLVTDIRRLTLSAELLCREGTFNGVLAGRWLLNDRALMLEAMERQPAAWQAWRDAELSQWAAAEAAREGAWRAADRLVLDSETLWALRLLRAREVAEWGRIGSWLGGKPEILYYYSKSWLGIREWRHYFSAAKHFRSLLDGEAEQLEKWRKKHLGKRELFADELLVVLDDYHAARQEVMSSVRRAQLAIAREMYRRDHRGVNPVHDRDLVPRYLKTLPVDPESGKPFDERPVPREE